MSGSNADVTSGITEALPTGVALGVGAFVINYIITFVFVVLDGADLSGASSWKVVGMVLFNAHQVSLEISSSVISGSMNLLTGGMMASQTALGSTVPTIVYQIVPILVLIGFGFFVAQSARAADPVTGALAGATITAGYVLLAVVGVFLFNVSQQGASMGPSVLMGIVLAGIVYPLVTGAIGGAAAGASN